jgi:AcrR family transcriptional regulator
MEMKPETRGHILDAAEVRFRRYGFAKTTMVELACDCGMSAGNLYRYFDNKEEIGAQVAARCMRDHEEIGRGMLGRSDLGAGEKLEAFVLAVAMDTYARVIKDSELNDLVLHITEKRNDIVEQHVHVLIDIISRILAEGDASGEFEIADLATSAQAVLLACKGVVHPLLLCEGSAEEAEANSLAVVRLLIKGLRRH